MDAKLICGLVVLCFGLSAIDACKDKASYCSSWPDSYCQRYPDYMKKNCAKKCGYCGTTECKDVRPANDCAGWKSSGYCDKSHRYHSFMKYNCEKTCGFCGTQPGTTKPPITTKPPVTNPTGPSGSCSSSSKLEGCSFNDHSCDFVDVPFDDDHNFALRRSGGQDNGGYISSSGSGKAELIYPLELLVPHNGDHGNMCMEFYYRISGRGSLLVFQVTNGKNYWKDTKLSLSDSQGSWKKAQTSFRASQRYHLMFRATPNSGSIDIDSIRFCDRCN